MCLQIKKINANILEGEKLKWDLGIEAVEGPFGEREVENSAPCLTILFRDEPKRVDLKICRGVQKDLPGSQVELLPGSFRQ